MNNKTFAKTSAALALLMGSATAMAACPTINYSGQSPGYASLTQALKDSVTSTEAVGTHKPTGGTLGTTNGGLDFDMWVTIVGTDGTVCLVTKSGSSLDHQWLASRVISAQKANTALSLSTADFALSSANLYSAVQPGGSLWGLQAANPVDPGVAYSGNSAFFGSSTDPMIGRKIGGTNVFGGGLALYDGSGKLVGGLGVSGDTSCADHNVSWRVRHALGLDNVPQGVNGNPAHKADNIIFLGANEAPNGFKHPTCGGTEDTVNAGLPY